MDNIVLQNFQRFKETFVSSNLPNNILLEMIESYIQPDNQEQIAPDVPILDGQLSLFDSAA